MERREPRQRRDHFTLTNNSNRSVNPSGSQYCPTQPTPRLHRHEGLVCPDWQPQRAPGAHEGRHFGHTFNWDVYLFGAESTADVPTLVNLSALTADQDFSSPDGLAFSKSSGICWIQTDDGAYTDVSNCMMLAAVPGSVGDGGKKTLSYTKADGSKLDIVTPVGKAATADTLKRFLVGPWGAAKSPAWQKRRTARPSS